jgi:hypothetical protein
VFGAIEPKFGGGAPHPVVVYLSQPVAWLSPGPVEASLLDETDRGLYVLPAEKAKALFIPDRDISAIYFGGEADIPKQSDAKKTK